MTFALQTPNPSSQNEYVIGGCIRVQSQRVWDPRTMTFLTSFPHASPLIFPPNSITQSLGSALGTGVWVAALRRALRWCPGTTRFPGGPTLHLWEGILGERETPPGAKESWSPSYSTEIPVYPPPARPPTLHRLCPRRAGIGPRKRNFSLLSSAWGCFL